ncbi:AtpZ/AtpI family protein [Skermania piniformis]|uniref:AtpZ/AtpI family protein n=1 Tax=Skermania pinensis TaxID=39122 RepID=A0ABX8SA63_9ACTN|nr:AtpZ/AtpI family protein [Skermania piniformis]QXQ14753.1 AtpZ/AtpI family protein [Skermania piniformis]
MSSPPGPASGLPQEPSNPGSSGSPSPRQLIGFGAGIVGFVVFGLVVGWAADRAFGTSPVLIMVGLGLGVIGAVWSMITQVRKFMKD